MVTLAFKGGGPERETVLLSNALAAKGCRVAVVSLRDDGLEDASFHPSVRIIIVRQPRLRYAVPGLRRTIRMLAPRTVVGSGIPSLNLAALIAIRSLPGNEQPTLILREGAVPSLAHLDPSRSNRIAYLVLRHVYRYADRIVTPTHGARCDLLRDFSVPESKLSVMGTTAAVTDSMMERMQCETNLGREDDLIVCVARLAAEKDHQTLLRAVTLLPPARHWRLAIVGEGPERAALKGFVDRHGLAQRVIFTGHLADPLVLMRKAWVAVCSSIYEGFGNAIVEALACGTPVVSTDCPHGPREILAGGQYGTLTPVGDPVAMAAAIEAALDSAPDRGLLMRRACVFTAERAATRLLEIAKNHAPNAAFEPALVRRPIPAETTDT